MTPAIVIAVVVAIPAMIMLKAAMRTIPVAGVEAATFMARADPVRAGVWWTSPISLMPDVNGRSRDTSSPRPKRIQGQD